MNRERDRDASGNGTTTCELSHVLLKLVSRPGLEPGTLALKWRKGQQYQWLDFTKVSPFFLCEQGLERILSIPLIL
jgi:hypothetical protein